MENEIELFLANRDSVIHQTKLVQGDEIAQLFEMHIISSCLKKCICTEVHSHPS